MSSKVRAQNPLQLKKMRPFNVDLSRLPAVLRAYWTRNSISDRNCPDDAEVQVGSRIKMRAHETHVDIGCVYAHPSLDGHPRFTLRPCIPGISSGCTCTNTYP